MKEFNFSKDACLEPTALLKAKLIQEYFSSIFKDFSMICRTLVSKNTPR